jgi:F-type H+-transporting ATPase subunit a
MASPFDHVMDSHNWHLVENWGLHFHLPKIYIPGYGNFQITKFMVLEVVAAGLILAIYVPIARWAKDGEPPNGGPVKRFIWNTFECMLTWMRRQVIEPNVGHHDADRFVPFLWTIFLFVLFCNLLGMFPYLGSPTASIVVTGVLALFSFCAIHLGAIWKLGLGGYMKSYVPHVEAPFGMGYFIVPLIVMIEILGQFIKTFVLAVRLFANMFAGHTVLAVILLFIVMARGSYMFWPVTLASVLGVTALSLLELFVAFLQAYIFTFLTALFLGTALHPQH